MTNPWQISSVLRIRVLRAFGAEIGNGVILRPRTRVKFPWKLHIGDRSWIGEGVWFHNQDHIYIGHDVVISQETFATTGSHGYRRDNEPNNATDPHRCRSVGYLQVRHPRRRAHWPLRSDQPRQRAWAKHQFRLVKYGPEILPAPLATGSTLVCGR